MLLKYTYKLIKSTDYTPTYWSGGMATELTTYPSGSSFAGRDFLWRLGFAKIDIDTSTFSSLPGIKRHLMVTDGCMTLSHKDRYSKELKPFSQDFFMGDWITTTEGRCSVFNLMTRENYDGSLSHIEVLEHSSYNFKYDLDSQSGSKPISLCFHPLSGSFSINLNDDIVDINYGDLLIIDFSDYDSDICFNINNSLNDKSDIIAALIIKSE